MIQSIDEIQQLYKKIPKQVIAKFNTELTQYRIDGAQIDLPTEMDEIQCNKLLKNLLQQSLNQATLDSLHFQFLVGGKLLRGQLKSHMVRYQINCEQTLEIQYFLTFEPLQNNTIIKQEDWVSVLQVIYHPAENLIVGGLFNGQAVFHSKANHELLKASVDQDCLKAIKVMTSQSENTYYMISGGVNEEIRVSNFHFSNQGEVSFNLISSTQIPGSVLAISANPLDDGHFCAATNLGNLLIYKIPDDFLSQAENQNQTKKIKKKRHLNLQSIHFVASQILHKDSINSVNWITQDRIVTGSSDHSMKLVDVQKMKEIGTVLTKDSITTSIDYSLKRLLTSHEDGYIRQWDIRSPQTATNTFKAHSKLVSSVKFNSNPNIFSSGSYDTTVKIWDCRSSFPLQNIGSHQEKVFSVIWKSEKQLAAGGADSKITLHGL